MAMLTAAFDCSEAGDRNYFVMAGFVSSAVEWADFDREWRTRLAVDGLPYFHMWAFAAATRYTRKPFDQTWLGAEERRRKLLSDLLDIIASHGWRKFGCIIPADAQTWLSTEARARYADTAIALAGRLIWSDLEQWRKVENFRQPARLVFEDGDAHKSTLRSAIRQVTGRDPSFEYKQDNPERNVAAFTPLQASDLLAYEIQKLTRSDGQEVSSFRFPYKQLEKIPGDIRMLQKAGAGRINELASVEHYFGEHPLILGLPVTASTEQ